MVSPRAARYLKECQLPVQSAFKLFCKIIPVSFAVQNQLHFYKEHKNFSWNLQLELQSDSNVGSKPMHVLLNFLFVIGTQPCPFPLSQMLGAPSHMENLQHQACSS